VEADQAHYSMDILVNIGVIGVLLGLRAGLPHWIDPVFGVAVVIYLGVMVTQIAGKGVDMLLDRELPGNAREVITSKVLSHPYVMGMHDLRTNKSGMRVFISFDIELDPSLLLYHAHEIVREVEHELLLDFPNAEILIHADPHGDTYDTRHHAATKTAAAQ
jgi:ferrous-iron efflux pump FieF